MDADHVRAVQSLLLGTEWVAHTRDFARSLRGAGHTPGSLLLVGTDEEEPWHLAAHLDQEAMLGGIPELSPILVRHAPPPGAPAHLAIGLDRLEQAHRGETLFVVAPTAVTEGLLERVHDARRAGATVLALESGDRELRAIAHDSLSVNDDDQSGARVLRVRQLHRVSGVVTPAAHQAAFDTAQHLVSLAAGEIPTRSGFRDRISRLVESMSRPTQTRP